MTRVPLRRRLAAVTLVCAGVLALGACEDDPFGLGNWNADPDTALLYSLARPDLNLPSAINFDRRILLRVESPDATGNWDIAVDTEGGGLVFLAAPALGINSRARIATFPGMDFDEVVRAPSDTTVYVATEPVPVDLSTTYVIRTGEGIGSFGQRCVFFAKLQPLEVDVARGTVRFVFDSNPICNQFDLVPPN